MVKSFILAAALALGANSVSALTLDFTDLASYDTTASTATVATGTFADVTWTATAFPAGTELSYNMPFGAPTPNTFGGPDTGYDGDAGPHPSGLALFGDGLGVKYPGTPTSDEVTFPIEFIKVTFSKMVGVLGFSVLDLYRSDTRDDREEAIMTNDGGLAFSESVLASELNPLENGQINALGGWKSTSFTQIDTDTLIFKAGPGLDDSVADFALASIEILGDENNIPETPLPAAGLMLIGALGGAAALRRRRKS